MSISRRSFLKSASAAPFAAAAISIPAMTVGSAMIGEAVAAPASAVKIPHDWTWWFSDSNGETFNECFPTKEAAIEYAANSGGGLVAECLQQDFDLRLDGYQLFEMMQDANEEIIGEGDFIDASNEQLSELENEVNAVIKAWADKHNLYKTAWQFAGTRNSINVEQSAESKERERLQNERWRAFQDARDSARAQSKETGE